MRKRTSETGEYRRNKRDVTGRPRPEMFVQACAITSREPARRFLDYLMTAAHNMYIIYIYPLLIQYVYNAVRI
jgi:hypothetical protein